MKHRLKTAQPAPNRRIYGTLAANLDAAVMSATRLRHQKVYADTLRHWRELVALARQSVLADGLERSHPIALAADHLERELNERAAAAPESPSLPGRG